jgi:polygalacturonase
MSKIQLFLLALVAVVPSALAQTCTVTAVAQVASATASCTSIVLSNLAVPTSTTLNLSKLKTGTTVTFAGKTVRPMSLEQLDILSQL